MWGEIAALVASAALIAAAIIILDWVQRNMADAVERGGPDTPSDETAWGDVVSFPREARPAGKGVGGTGQRQSAQVRTNRGDIARLHDGGR